MNYFQSAGSFQLVVLVAFLIPAILFILTQHRTLEAIRPENRRMSPGQVWLQMIPIFGLVWQFIVINKISDSIRDELNTPMGDSIFAEDTLPTNFRPTFSTGASYAALFCISIIPIPIIKGLAAWAGLILWIVYWVQLAQYKRKLKDRGMILNNEYKSF